MPITVTGMGCLASWFGKYATIGLDFDLTYQLHDWKEDYTRQSQPPARGDPLGKQRLVVWFLEHMLPHSNLTYQLQVVLSRSFYIVSHIISRW
jgi:hypothetical protein